MNNADLMPIELATIDRQQRRFSWISGLAIIVSFVHMAAALALFSDNAWYERGAALAMTGLVDIATWALAGYFDYARRRQTSRSGWIKTLFGFALVISMFLNGAYLYTHRPPPTELPEWMSIGIAITFAVFVPMLIGVASLIRGELEDDRLALQQAARHTVDAAQLEADLAQARAELEKAQTETAQTRDQLAQHEMMRAHHDDQAARMANDLAQRDTALAQLTDEQAHRETQMAQSLEQLRESQEHLVQRESEIAHLREELAQVRDDLARPMMVGEVDLLVIAQRMLQAGIPTRETAACLHMAESTMRSRLKRITQQNTNGAHATVVDT
ncbi:MAG: hypothetical protein AAGF95_26570 [Chloroflexota bacterium]